MSATDRQHLAHPGEKQPPTVYLGTHMPNWLEIPGMPPLFVAHPRLKDRKRLPRAVGAFAIDSGAFSEIDKYGAWVTTQDEYIDAIRRYVAEIGDPVFVAPRDMMCEPVMIARTGLSVEAHIQHTVADLVTLREAAPDIAHLVIPVLQGWEIADYLRCADLYAQAGVDLTAERLVGLGSVCRRQSSAQIGAIAAVFASAGVALHGFGVKTDGIARYGWSLASSDSLAWSKAGKTMAPGPECAPGHRTEQNCPVWAKQWYRRVVAKVPRFEQLGIEDALPPAIGPAARPSPPPAAGPGASPRRLPPPPPMRRPPARGR